MERSLQTGFVKYKDSLSRGALCFSHEAMATVFEIYMFHEDRRYAEQCAFQAFEEVDRLEQDLSRFIENSDISRINRSGYDDSVQVGIDTYECLEQCISLSGETKGAFDITAGPLMQRWRESDKKSGSPSPDEIADARDRCGIDNIILHKNDFSVSLMRENMVIDLGGFGKGYAVDRAVKVLKEWDIGPAVVHGGSSSVFAMGAPPGETGWEITLRNPRNTDEEISRMYLNDRALNSSGIRKGNHIINPKTGHPVSERSSAWVFCNSAATGDALSTAFMIMSRDEINDLCLKNGDIQGVIIDKVSPESASEDEKEEIFRFGVFDRSTG